MAGAAPAARPSAPAPWDQPGARAQPQAMTQAQAQAQAQPQARVQPQPAASQAYAQGNEQAVADDEPPAWVTAFSDDTAVAFDAPATVSAPASAPAPARAPAASAPAHAYVITPVPALGWDGNWPALAASLPLRGVSQQLAFQTELLECVSDGASATFRLRVPVDTLRASGNSEKLCAALQECFPAVRVNIDTEIGPVWYTASAEARARREQLQHEAEETVAADPFIQAMERSFDAFVVPGSVRPIGT
jgi:DNA polymerase-3 subunit gamma/tau